MNLTTIAREHYLPAMEKRNCPDTAEGYRSSIELHVLPRFGEMELEEIEHEDVQDWVNEIAPECGIGGAVDKNATGFSLVVRNNSTASVGVHCLLASCPLDRVLSQLRGCLKMPCSCD